MKGLGIIEVNGREYVVLAEKDAGFNICYASSGYYPENSINIFVARRFPVESAELKNGEVVLSVTDHFVTPRWMTIHGDYVINWFPEPIEVNVEDTWIKQEEK